MLTVAMITVAIMATVPKSLTKTQPPNFVVPSVVELRIAGLFASRQYLSLQPGKNAINTYWTVIVIIILLS